KAASWCESRKSTIDLLQADRKQFGRRQCAAQIYMGHTFPGVADPAVHLNGGLAHRARSPRAVDLRDLGGEYRRARLKFVDRQRTESIGGVGGQLAGGFGRA